MREQPIHRPWGESESGVSGALVGSDIDRFAWRSEDTGSRAQPADAEEFALQAILAICAAGVPPAVGRRAFERCRRALAAGATVRVGFRHPGKSDAIDAIWRERVRLHRACLAAADPVAALDELPWIGPVTKRRLAAALGLAGAPADPDAGKPMKVAA